MPEQHSLLIISGTPLEMHLTEKGKTCSGMKEVF
jgi:hypothetical protein